MLFLLLHGKGGGGGGKPLIYICYIHAAYMSAAKFVTMTTGEEENPFILLTANHLRLKSPRGRTVRARFRFAKLAILLFFLFRTGGFFLGGGVTSVRTRRKMGIFPPVGGVE